MNVTHSELHCRRPAQECPAQAQGSKASHSVGDKATMHRAAWYSREISHYLLCDPKYAEPELRGKVLSYKIIFQGILKCNTQLLP